MTAIIDATVITEPGVYDLPAASYFADPVPEGSLSNSGMVKLLPPYCPAIFRWEQDNPVIKDEFDFGHAAHKKVLGDLDTEVKIVDADTWRGKAATEAKDEARANGLVPLLKKDWLKVCAMADALVQQPVAAKLLAPGSGQPEQSMFWQDADTSVWRRARVDWLPNKRGGKVVVPDYKTSRHVYPDLFAKSAGDYGYYMQAAQYSDGITALGLADEVVFAFIAQMKEPPYLVTVNFLEERAIELGRRRIKQAIRVWQECRANDEWPGYPTEVNEIALPSYLYSQIEDTL